MLFMLFVRNSKPLLVIDGLKLLAVQLKDVGVCATMVRLSVLMIIARLCLLFHCMIAQVRGGIIQHVRACVDTWEKEKVAAVAATMVVMQSILLLVTGQTMAFSKSCVLEFVTCLLLFVIMPAPRPLLLYGM